MDNRLKFLYYSMSELWGHRRKGRAGNEETGASEVGVKLEKPGQAGQVYNRQIRCIIRRRDADRNLVGKYVSHASRKAAIVLIVPVP